MEILGLKIEIVPANRSTAKASSKRKTLRLDSKSLKVNVNGIARDWFSARHFALPYQGLRSRVYAVAKRAIPALRLTESFQLEVRPTDDGWVIAENGSSLPLRVFDKKDRAVREAKKMARHHKTQVNIFGRDGGLKDRQSFA